MAPSPPPPLIRYLRERRCVLFVGSGLSAWAGLPTWGALLRDLLSALRHEAPEGVDFAELDALLAAGKFLEVADYCKEVFGERRYGELLADRLRGGAVPIPEPHRLIARLSLAAIVTTNYDKLLERAYASVADLPKTHTHLDIDALGSLLFTRAFFILKAHGDIDKPDSLVLTARDYRQIIHENPALHAIFSAILLTNATLFVGYSLGDPDFRLLLDRQLSVFKGNIPERYALMTGVGRVEQDILWRTARIRVLPYTVEDGRHDAVLDFLRALVEVSQEPVAAATPASALAGAARGLAPSASVASAGSVSAGAHLVPPAVEDGRPTPDASLILALRPRGRALESVVAAGDRGVLARGEGALPAWPELARLVKPVARAGAPLAAYAAVGQALAAACPPEVLRALAEELGDAVVTLRVAAELEPVPWEWLWVVDGHLCLRRPVVRAPISISDEARGFPIVRQPVRVLLLGDPTGDLPGARGEVERIAAVYARSAPDPRICQPLLGAEATFDAVVRQLLTGGYDVVHFAGHAWYDAQEAYLALHDHVVLRASELGSLLSPRPPAILVLNSHYSAFIPPGARLDERGRPTEATSRPGPTGRGKGGFIEVASTTGVGILIGCCGSPDDLPAAEIGVRLHEELLAGAPAGLALHRARGTVGGPDALLYVASGYPQLALP